MLQAARPVSRRAISRTISFGSPVKGLKLFDDISATPEGGALVLDNVVCGSDVVRMRHGSTQRSTGLGGEARAIMGYVNGNVSKLFAVGGTGLFDATSPGALGAALVTGLTPAPWSAIQFATSGGVFLVAVSRGNGRRLYDGTSWATTPAITGVTVNSLSQVWAHANRLFFVEAGTMNAWYLMVDAIGGAATKFPLGGLFTRGGELVAGATWTSDAGDSGLRSQCVFISSQGEAAVYDGPDPASWTLTGVYRVGRPCGINCFMKTGGDLAVMTEDGLLAMSQVVSLDAAALVNRSVSKDIRPLWREAVAASDVSRWTITRRDAAGYAIISIPAGGTFLGTHFVANLQTGAWSTFSGWPATVMTEFGGQLLFGTADGRIVTGEDGGGDDGAAYSMTFVGPFRRDKNGRSMNARLARGVVRSVEGCQSQVSTLFDYRVRIPTPPAACALNSGGGIWNSSEWNAAQWGGGKEVRDGWRPAHGQGFAVAPCVQYTIGQVVAPQVDLIRADLILETGGALA